MWGLAFRRKKDRCFVHGEGREGNTTCGHRSVELKSAWWPLFSASLVKSSAEREGEGGMLGSLGQPVKTETAF